MKDPKPHKQAEFVDPQDQQTPDTIMNRFLANFRGGNKLQRGGGWALKGGGLNTASFGNFSAGTISADQTPSVNNTYALGNPSFKWSNIATVLINGITPRAGSVTVYVAASSGGAVTTQLIFNGGILT